VGRPKHPAVNLRMIIFLPALAAACLGQTTVSPSVELSARLHSTYKFVPPAEAAKAVDPAPEDETVEKLEPFTVTADHSFEKDLAEATRRAAAEREAAKFSPLTGGLILAKQLGRMELKLGLWPQVIAAETDLPPRYSPKLRVDVLRIDW